MWEKITPIIFLSTPSARRATNIETSFYQGTQISIHALCEEGDLSRMTDENSVSTFLSTPSARRATLPPQPRGMARGNFYPRPLRGGRRDYYLDRGLAKIISIHALCEEGDTGSAS